MNSSCLEWQLDWLCYYCQEAAKKRRIVHQLLCLRVRGFKACATESMETQKAFHLFCTTFPLGVPNSRESVPAPPSLAHRGPDAEPALGVRWDGAREDACCQLWTSLSLALCLPPGGCSTSSNPDRTLVRKGLFSLPNILGKVIFNLKIFFHVVFIMRKSNDIFSHKGLKKCYINVHTHTGTPSTLLCQKPVFHQIYFSTKFLASYSCVSPLLHHLYSWSFVKNDSIKPPMLLARRGV